MSWEHAHFNKAFAVFLTSGSDELPDPDAIFFTEEEAKEYIARERRKQMLDDYSGDELRAKVAGRTPEDYLHEAGTQEVRNLYVPWWNSLDPVPEADPEPIPEHLGTIVSPDEQFLAMFFHRVSMVCACLRNYQRSHAEANLNGAIELAKEVATGLEVFNQFFRELH
jgi:hypothetical protein